MKNRILAGLLSLSIFGAGALAPKNAEALIITLGAISDHYDHDHHHGHHHHSGGVWIITDSIETFFFFLFFLVLDEKSDAQGLSITKQELLDNGYTELEVEQINADQAKLLEKLSSQNISLKLDKKETRESLRRDLLSIESSLSDLYINTIADAVGL